MCHIQNGSGYETFFDVKMVPKTVSTPVSSSHIADFVAGGSWGEAPGREGASASKSSV